MAKYDAFIGGSYQSQSTLADCERTMNWYPEMLQSQGATAKLALYPTPGVTALDSVGVGNGRGHVFAAGREFLVIGAKLYEADVNGTLTDRGDVALDSNPATITYNGDGGDQLFITSGTNGYCYELSTDVLTQVAAMDGKCTMGDMMDGRFLVLDASTSTFYVSALFDGQTWTPGTDFAQRSLAPDAWRAMKVVGRLVWLFGSETSEAWYDTGANFPFAPAPSGLITFGIAAPFSAVIIGNDIIWLGSTKSGRVCVVKATGYSPEVLSNYPLESHIETYDGVSSAVGDAYSDQGHTFYVLGFDQADATWVWDSETRLWHERGTWISSESRYVVWRPRYYARAFDEHRMLDASGGYLYRMANDLLHDVDGIPIRRLRRAPAILDENKRVFYSEFELDLEPGLASISPTKASFRVAALPIVSGTVWTQPGDEQTVGATVKLFLVEGMVTTLIDTTTTNASGFYQFLNAPIGNVTVEGSKGALISGTNGGTTVAGETLTLDITLTRPD